VIRPLAGVLPTLVTVLVLATSCVSAPPEALVRLRVPRVTLNGAVVPGAQSSIDITVDITEFRQGGSPGATLLARGKHYHVSILTDRPVAVLDAELPVAATGTRFTVVVEDGREFLRCLVAGLRSGPAPGSLVYKLQCEDMIPP
jgi:hypothetical protein